MEKDRMPDPKVIVDSVCDSVVEIAEGPFRVASNVANACQGFANSVKANMDEVKRRTPDDPMVIPEIVPKALGDTIDAGVNLFQGIFNGVGDTARAVRNQLVRISR